MSNRFLKDAELIKTKALPAAGATANGDSIDLGAVEIGPTGDLVEAEVSVPATPSLVESETITVTLEDSADDSSFTAIPELATLVVTGAALAAGGAAATRKVRLPRTTRRYIRASAAVSASGGSNIAVSFSLSLIG